MMKVVVLAVALLLGAHEVQASSCITDGKPIQTVSLSHGGKDLGRWSPKSGYVHRVELSDGFMLGIRVEPATEQKYLELLSKLPAVAELVKIELYDLKHSESTPISHSWGGANSKQGFRPNGQKIELWFHKPVCITRETLARR